MPTASGVGETVSSLKCSPPVDETVEQPTPQWVRLYSNPLASETIDVPPLDYVTFSTVNLAVLLFP